MTETGLNKRIMFWFFGITSFLISMIAIFTEGVANGAIVNSYLVLSGTMMSFIIGAKTVDNSFKTKIEEAKINKENQ